MLTVEHKKLLGQGWHEIVHRDVGWEFCYDPMRMMKVCRLGEFTLHPSDFENGCRIFCLQERRPAGFPPDPVTVFFLFELETDAVLCKMRLPEERENYGYILSKPKIQTYAQTALQAQQSR